MRYYETVYIINPNFEQSRLDSIAKEVEKFVGEFGKIISHNIWGKKKLAYQIDNQKYGTFVLLHFESDNTNRIIDFESFMKLNSSILRSQTIRLGSRPTASVLEKTITIDSEETSDSTIEKETSKETLKVEEEAEKDTDSEETTKEEAVEEAATEEEAVEEDDTGSEAEEKTTSDSK